MVNELFHESVPPILHEDDLNAMYFSIENRSPFLDRGLFDWCQSIPTRHLVRNGLRMLAWLLAGETRNGHLSVVPAGGWGRGEDRPSFDQHPSQVAALADACARAAAVTGDTTWLTGVEMSVTWLLGDNDARIPMLDERTGGCSDALSRNRRSRNQGAESTLAMIAVLQHGRLLNAAAVR